MTSASQTARPMGRIGPAYAAIIAVTVTLVGAALLLALGGYSPVEAFAALAQGSFGSWNTFVSFTLVRSTPLLLTGLAVAIAFTAGVWNIGAEGQLYVGALAGVAVATVFTSGPAVGALPTPVSKLRSSFVPA